MGRLITFQYALQAIFDHDFELDTLAITMMLIFRGHKGELTIYYLMDPRLMYM